jgi:hypothetical protein
VKRFVAITASVVMICVAIVIRSSINDGDSGTTPAPTGPVTIACVTELAPECKALTGVTVRIEEAAVTAKAIANGTAGINGWVTFDPWPEMTNLLSGRDNTGSSTLVAKTGLVIAMVQERASVLAPTCPATQVDWRCLGDAIGRPWTDFPGGKPDWGTVKVTLPPTSGTGTLLLGNAATGYFSRTDFATNDFDDAFGLWRANLTASTGTFTTFIQLFPAAFSAIGTTEVEVARGVGTRPVATIVPIRKASAIVVLTAVNGGRVDRLSSELGRLLETNGWSTKDLARTTELPNPGVLLALSGLTR